MAKDDYDVIVYRILVYLYGCFKHEIMFEDLTFEAAVRKHVKSDEYFTGILQMMQEEGFITGLVFVNAWGGDVLLASDMRDVRITAKGIHYLEDNDKMKKVGEMLKGAVDLIASLASILSLV